MSSNEQIGRDWIKRDGLGVLWDFDGTLFDTWLKNLTVTRSIVRQVLSLDPDAIPALTSVEDYVRAHRQTSNWRDFYTQHFGLDEETADHAGSFWVTFQLEDRTGVQPIQGVVDVIEEFRDLPQGIVSQNARQVILKVLEANQLDPHFGSVIGHGEVPAQCQKPEPHGLIRCLKELAAGFEGTVVFIGDHETDTLTAHNANALARREGLQLQFISVAAAYHEEVNVSAWAEPPDFVAERPSDILEIIRTI